MKMDSLFLSFDVIKRQVIFAVSPVIIFSHIAASLDSFVTKHRHFCKQTEERRFPWHNSESFISILTASIRNVKTHIHNIYQTLERSQREGAKFVYQLTMSARPYAFNLKIAQSIFITFDIMELS
jgi:hypothetical protein